MLHKSTENLNSDCIQALNFQMNWLISWPWYLYSYNKTRRFFMPNEGQTRKPDNHSSKPKIIIFLRNLINFKNYFSHPYTRSATSLKELILESVPGKRFIGNGSFANILEILASDRLYCSRNVVYLADYWLPVSLLFHCFKNACKLLAVQILP